MSDFLSHRNAKDLSGQWFGNLFAFRPVSRCPGGIVWYCLCSCGNKVEVVAAAIIYGSRNSCGCKRWGERSEKQVAHLLKFSTSSRIVKRSIERRIAEQEEDDYTLDELWDIRDEIDSVVNGRTSFVPAMAKYTA